MAATVTTVEWMTLQPSPPNVSEKSFEEFVSINLFDIIVQIRNSPVIEDFI